MKNLKFAFFLIFVSLLVSACAGSSSDSVTSSGSSGQNARPQPTIASENAPEDVAVKSQVSLEQAGQSQTPPAPVERKIIRNAEMTLETEAPEESAQKISALAESRGGFVIESQQQNNDTQTRKINSVSMTVRVPADKFNEALEEIRKTGSRVVTETVKGQDVTEEFIDIEARLKTKRALEAQFLEIMKQGRTVEDALNVQREIATVRGEIEQIEGRKRFLENQSAFSTFKIRLQTPATISGNSKGFFYRLTEALSDGVDGALGFVLFFLTALIALLPFLLLIVLPIYLLIRYLLKRRRKQISAREIAREEIKVE